MGAVSSVHNVLNHTNPDNSQQQTQSDGLTHTDDDVDSLFNLQSGISSPAQNPISRKLSHQRPFSLTPNISNTNNEQIDDANNNIAAPLKLNDSAADDEEVSVQQQNVNTTKTRYEYNIQQQQQNMNAINNEIDSNKPQPLFAFEGVT